MKKLLFRVPLLLISAVCIAVLSAHGEESRPVTYQEVVRVAAPQIASLKQTPFSNIVIRSPDGREARIDFGGETLTISGDLPADEAAQVFFENVFLLYRDRCR